MQIAKQTLGKIGEELAVRYLKKKGYKILDRNFKASHFGEIDIVAQIQNDADKSWTYAKRIFSFIRNSVKFVISRKSPEATIVFVEVKTKASDEFGSPEDEFTFFKKQKMLRAIQDWFWQKKIETKNWRIDLVAVDFSKDKKGPKIRHYPGLS